MDLTGAELGVCLLVIFVGAVVRGYTGFGSSLIWVSGLTLVLDPDEAIPVIFMLEVVASGYLLRNASTDVHWNSVKPLLVGAMIGTPFGVVILSSLDPGPMQIVVSVVVLVSVVLLASGWQSAQPPTTSGAVATGVASGVLNGATSGGGPPVVVFYLASSAKASVGRASVIAYFGATDVVAAILLAATGVLATTAVLRLAALLPAMLLGAALGARGFSRASEAQVQLIALVALAVLAITGLLNTLL